MNITTKTLGVIFALALTLSANAWTIRPGLQQAKGLYPCGDEASMNQFTPEMSSLFEDSFLPLEVVPGPMMADVQNNESFNLVYHSYVSRTGANYHWVIGEWPAYIVLAYAYRGEAYFEAGKTYVFAKKFSDQVIINIDDVEIMNHRIQSEFATASYTPETTGWHKLEVLLVVNNTTDVGEYHPWENKGPHDGGIAADQHAIASEALGAENCGLGLAWNSEGKIGLVSDASLWKAIREPGDMSVFRYFDADEEVIRLSGALRTDSGYKVTASFINNGTGRIRMLASSTPIDSVSTVDPTDGWEYVSNFAEEGNSATFDLTWPEESPLYIAFLAEDGNDLLGEGFNAASAVIDIPAIEGASRTLIASPVVNDGVITSIDLAFNEASEEISNVLYVAYGQKNGGDNMNAWEHVEELAIIDGATTAYSYLMPAGWGDTILSLRFFLINAKSLPYWKEVAFVESNGGGASFSTGYTPTAEDKMQARFIYRQGFDQGIFRAGSGRYNFCWSHNVDGYLQMQNNWSYSGLVGYYANFKYYGRTQIANLEFGNNYVRDIDEESTFMTGAVVESVAFDGPVIWFSSFYDYGRLYSARFLNGDDEVIHNYIPVVDWNGEAGFYDTIGGTMHRNASASGMLRPGPTVAVNMVGGLAIASSQEIALGILYMDRVPTMSVDDAGNRFINARLESGTGDLIAIYSDGENEYEQTLASDVTGPCNISVAMTDSLPADHTYTFSVRAENDKDNPITLAGEGIFYTGSPTIISNGNLSMIDMTSGEFVISRADAHAALTVNYAVSGTAGNGTDFVRLGGSVVIPDGATSVAVPVKPIWNGDLASKATIVISLIGGDYVTPNDATTQLEVTPPEARRVLGYWTFTSERKKNLDSSGNGYTLISEDVVIEDGAAKFNGTSSVMQTIDDFDLTTSHELTVEAFVKFTSGKSDIFLCEYGANAYGDTGCFNILFGESYPGRLDYMMSFNGYGCYSAGSEGVLNDGEWHHVAVVMRPAEEDYTKNKLVYVDHQGGWYVGYLGGANWQNVRTEEQFGPFRFPGGRKFNIGCRNYNSLFFDGLMDDLKVTNRALSPSEFMPLDGRTKGIGGLTVIVH